MNRKLQTKTNSGLHKSKRNYSNDGEAKALLNLLSEPAVIVNEKGFLLIINDVFEEVTGLKSREVLGKPFMSTNIATAENKARLLKNLKKRMQGTNVKPYEICFTGKNGKALYVEVKGRKVSYARQPAILAVFHDITRRKENARRLKEYSEQMEALVNKKVQEIQESEEKFRTIITCAKDAIIAADSEGKIVYWNPAAERILGFTQEDAIGRNVLTLLINPQHNDFNQIFLRVIRNKQLIQGQPIEITVLRKDGTKLPAELSVGLMKINNKHCLMGIVRDISERKKAEERIQEYANILEEKVAERTRQLEETNKRLVKAERFAAIGELAGMIGHDLRNPLTGIKNAAYYLKTKHNSCSEENRKKMFDAIENAIAHADKIINDLQEYSRDMQLELVKRSPKSILKEALIMIQVPPRVKILDGASEESISVDNVKMVRVFINLIQNAIDAMPEGGTLQIKSTQADENTEISFTDNGSGIPEETLAKLFTPLVTTKAKGMGFGLAICKRILEVHKGKITIKSVVGKGTTVSVIIPTEPMRKEEKEQMWVNVPEAWVSITRT